MKYIHLIVALDLLTANVAYPICFTSIEEAEAYCKLNNKDSISVSYATKSIAIGKFDIKN